MKNHSLFSFSPFFNPIFFLDRIFNPYQYKKIINFKDKNLEVKWTERAQQKLNQISTPLLVEMQLYFSCVVKKRVLFFSNADFTTTPVNQELEIAFHPVQSASCDPIEFVKNFPAEREFDSISAKKMRPRELTIDFKDNAWQGEFYI